MKFFKKIGVMQGRLCNDNIKSLSVYPKLPIKEFDLAAKLKLNHIEFITKESPYLHKENFIWNDKKINIINKIYKSKGLKSISFIDNRSSKKNITSLISYYKKLINQLSKAKFKIFIIPLINKSDCDKINLNILSKTLDKISQYCKKKKIMFLIETNTDFENFIKLSKLMRNKIGIVYDTGNKYLSDNKNYTNDLILFNKYIKHIHLKDRNYKGENVILGDGKVDFPKIFKNLKFINYKGNFTIESTRKKNAKLTLIKNCNYLKLCLKKINH